MKAQKALVLHKSIFDTDPEGPKLELYQVKMKNKTAQTKKLIGHTCPSGHGSDDSGPKWHTP